MGCVNALCVPFLVPYLLIYSFFRYFEVRIQSSECLRTADPAPGSKIRSLGDQQSAVYALCGVEVSRVQRTPPSLPPSSRHLIPNCKHVLGPIPQSTCRSHRTVLFSLPFPSLFNTQNQFCSLYRWLFCGGAPPRLTSRPRPLPEL